MDFRILGPLEVDDRGRRLPLRGPRQRALLASLLLRAGEIVPEDRLLDEVWRGEPPPSGGAALRVRISQLRKALAATGSPPALTSRPPGYVLEVDAGQVDALRFERLLGEGRRLLADGDPTAAAATLREALELWRGPALAEFADDPFAAAESARLEELRIQAVEERVKAELLLGRHRELAAELEGLVAEHPFRERLRGQLMLALYRSGRQAEALAAYRDVRSVYVEELGIEPTRRLQDMEQRILRQDSSLDAPAQRGRNPSAAPGGERKLATVLVAAPAGCPEDGDPERSSALLERFRDSRDRRDRELRRPRRDLRGRHAHGRIRRPGRARGPHAASPARSSVAAAPRRRTTSAAPCSSGSASTRASCCRAAGRAWPEPAVVEAARLQQAAQPGTILVGERAAATARHAFEFGPPSSAAPGESPGRPLLRALTRHRIARPAPVRRPYGRARVAPGRLSARGRRRRATARDGRRRRRRRQDAARPRALAGARRHLPRAASPHRALPRLRPRHDVSPDRRRAPRAARPARDGRARDGVAAARPPRDPGPRARPGGRRRAPPARSAGSPARRLRRVPGGAGLRPARGRARGGSPLGAGAAARPARTGAGRGLGAVAARLHGSAGAARAASRLGSPPERGDGLARAAAGCRRADAARRPVLAGRSARGALAPRRARRGKPVLPRGAALEPGRAARPGDRSAGTRQRARRPRGPDRSAPRDREGRPAGGRGDRPRLLGRTGARAARRGGTRLRLARGTRLRAAAAGLGAGGRARADVPARADARGCVRGRAEAAPRPPPRRVRRLAGAGRGRPRRARCSARTPLRRGRTARGRRPGLGRRRRRAGAASREGRHLARPGRRVRDRAVRARGGARDAAPRARAAIPSRAWS